MRLENKVAIITGAATGIGAGIADVFVREGAAVAIDYVHGQDQDAQQCVEVYRGRGGKAIAVEADVTQPDQVQRLIDSVVAEFGALDIFVNNAGIEKKVPFVDVPLDLWQKVIAVNLTGPFLCAQAAARQMIKQGKGGRIINISSVHEDLPMPTNVPYCASKGGLRVLMRTACVELAPHKITMNNIGPGAVDTPMDAISRPTRNCLKRFWTRSRCIAWDSRMESVNSLHTSHPMPRPTSLAARSSSTAGCCDRQAVCSGPVTTPVLPGTAVRALGRDTTRGKDLTIGHSRVIYWRSNP